MSGENLEAGNRVGHGLLVHGGNHIAAADAGARLAGLSGNDAGDRRRRRRCLSPTGCCRGSRGGGELEAVGGGIAGMGLGLVMDFGDLVRSVGNSSVTTEIFKGLPRAPDIEVDGLADLFAKDLVLQIVRVSRRQRHRRW